MAERLYRMEESTYKVIKKGNDLKKIDNYTYNR